ncbi:type II secretion system protein GspJ [Alisedimentitalea sp. MJ-SS2]|uniref:type II secretion system protein GspJ n=1 Tax=Aliisedimentitalea sp. MJ-SS2 TaxID=3049795 RepID=UPI0029113AA6|nr:type II secretion system protein GspJ [Alisedimentitalea sp. MJ-SS2]MDU8925814.1 type II secretion system protein GspJ [Alisedimentitalea sp. MJ-SS2]
MSRRMRERRDRTRGLTMIELVVAMSVFALVAVLGLQSLGGMLRQRDRAAEFAEAGAGLGRATSLIRQDLSLMVPVLFYPPGGGVVSALDADPAGNWMSLSVGNAHRYAPMGKSGLVERVEYRLNRETGQLLRGVWRTVWPVGADQKSPDIVVMEGVADLRIRSHWTGIGWIEGVRFAALDKTMQEVRKSQQDDAGVAAETYSDFLPQAVEITLVTQAFGDIRLLETLQ